MCIHVHHMHIFATLRARNSDRHEIYSKKWLCAILAKDTHYTLSFKCRRYGKVRIQALFSKLLLLLLLFSIFLNRRRQPSSICVRHTNASSLTHLSLQSDFRLRLDSSSYLIRLIHTIAVAVGVCVSSFSWLHRQKLETEID